MPYYRPRGSWAALYTALILFLSQPAIEAWPLPPRVNETVVAKQPPKSARLIFKDEARVALAASALAASQRPRGTTSGSRLPDTPRSAACTRRPRRRCCSRIRWGGRSGCSRARTVSSGFKISAAASSAGSGKIRSRRLPAATGCPSSAWPSRWWPRSSPTKRWRSLTFPR